MGAGADGAVFRDTPDNGPVSLARRPACKFQILFDSYNRASKHFQPVYVFILLFSFITKIKRNMRKNINKVTHLTYVYKQVLNTSGCRGINMKNI